MRIYFAASLFTQEDVDAVAEAAVRRLMKMKRSPPSAKTKR